jgi:hypothetical protein
MAQVGEGELPPSHGTSIAMTREKFIQSFSLEYLYRHREVGIRYAKRQARCRWRLMQKKASKDPDYAAYAASKYQLEEVV